MTGFSDFHLCWTCLSKSAVVAFIQVRPKALWTMFHSRHALVRGRLAGNGKEYGQMWLQKGGWDRYGEFETADGTILLSEVVFVD